MDNKPDRPMFDNHPDDPVDYTVCRVGLILAEVCSSNPDPRAVLERLTREHPIGAGHRWVHRNRPVGGDVYPRPCEHFPETHHHYLFQVI